MDQTVLEEYELACKLAQKEIRELTAAGKDTNPAVLDELLPDGLDVVQEIGLVEIPSERIIGVKSAGRIPAFTPTFRPLLDRHSEFAVKWQALCEAHLGPTGIREPIECFEYLGNFYVQEGNKRVSVLRHFGAPRIAGMVRRVMPARSEEPRIRAYYEFVDFYRYAKVYDVQFTRPGDYARLLTYVGKRPGEAWTETERRTFRSYYHYFQEAFQSLGARVNDIAAEDALLLWLGLYPYSDLGRLSAAELRKSLNDLWRDVVSSANDSVKVQTVAEDAGKGGILDWITSKDHIHVAFVHQLNPEKSPWTRGHEEGRKYLEEVMGDKVQVSIYYDAAAPEEMDAALEQAVAEGADVVFTTSPPLGKATLKAAVAHPKVRFLNCSVDQPYSSVCTYYGRIYEAKFITGAMAGAMANEDRIGYIASYPNFGVPASINAFAMGAQLTNPRAQIELRWSCVEGTPQADFFADGIRVISNKDAPTQGNMDFANYGTYLMADQGNLIPLGSPIWDWGKFYVFVIRSMLSGGWKTGRETTALNYWLGMDSGVIGLELSEKLPEGVRYLAETLRNSLESGRIQPFKRRIVAQDGSVKNDGNHAFTPEEMLKMDWLCDNVAGSIPAFDELLPVSQRLVRELGLYRDQIPPE